MHNSDFVLEQKKTPWVLWRGSRGVPAQNRFFPDTNGLVPDE